MMSTMNRLPLMVSTSGQAHPVDTFTAIIGSKGQLKNLQNLVKIDLFESHTDYHLKAGKKMNTYCQFKNK